MTSHSDQSDLLAVGRYLAAILRHKKVPDHIGLKHDAQGWMSIAEIIEKSAANRKAPPLSVETIDLAVQHCDKQRYAISPDRKMIRAKQGHSFPVDLGLKADVPPVVLYHGTVDRFFSSIMREGLTPQSRQHVHLSHEKETALNVGGRRKGEVIILEVDTKAMLAAGHVFHLSENGVWLTDFVPSTFLRTSRP
ncbi:MULTISPECIES: RNA 2'-phosphotransferase [Pseudomonas]|uniref:RNA 2'-phosphotransferase n=1 Tax=Pseudomonas TaxID=286 RepID=UPI000F034C39|nr:MULTISPECIES: RNA 2'-phosphotransferase [Pseudomonas]MBD8615459.1 RNA 2'-phosphotransferase [Pseudomonas putida]MBD8681888.1 RNA 2'-phosphotransferase [Pseudomonas sp. CFBP 13719]